MSIAKPNKTQNEPMKIVSVLILPNDTIEDAINKLGTFKKQDPNGHYQAVFEGIELNSWEFKDGKQVLEYYHKQKAAQRNKADSKQTDDAIIDNRQNVRDFLADSMDAATRTVITKEMIYSLEYITDGRAINDMQKQLLANLEAANLDDVQKQSIHNKITKLFTATLNALHMRHELDAITHRIHDLGNLDRIMRDELADETAEKGGKP